MNQKDIALAYASRGFSVFPCNPRTKVPVCSNGFKDASTDVDVVSSFWDEYPTALIGHPSEKVLIVDVDDHSLCPTGNVMMKHIREKMEGCGVYDEKTPRVSTISGGSHYYYKANPDVRRRIKPIAQVDILASGGYTILPDQSSYVMEGTESPWDVCERLPEFNVDKFERSIVEASPYSEALKSLLAKEPKKASTQISKYSTDMEKYNEVLEENGDEVNMGFIDYKKNKIEFNIKKGIYRRSNADIDNFTTDWDFTNDGPMRFGAGTLTNEKVMNLFHNQSIQTKLAEWMGMSVPEIGGKGTLMHSILPGHEDENPSLGLRWNEDATHLVARDFSNHFNDKYVQVDYNLVRLFATMRYDANVPRLNGPEFTTWFLLMMYEAGLIDVTHTMHDLPSGYEKLTAGQKIVMDAFIKLDAIKQLYEGYDGTTVFADKFSAAWCQLPPASMNRHKKALVKSGVLEHVGEYDCSNGKRTDGFFKTKLYRVPVKKLQEEPDDMKLNEAVNIQTSPSSERQADQVNNQFPEMTTLVKMIVDEKYQQKVRNFAEDQRLFNVPEYENMFVPVLISEDFEPLDIEQGSTYLMDQLIVDTFEGEFGQTMLVAYGTSPPIAEMIKKLSEDHNSLIENEEDFHFIISSDIEDTEVDLDYLTMQLNTYLNGQVALTEIDVVYQDDDSLIQMLDGFHPQKE